MSSVPIWSGRTFRSQLERGCQRGRCRPCIPKLDQINGRSSLARSLTYLPQQERPRQQAAPQTSGCQAVVRHPPRQAEWRFCLLWEYTQWAEGYRPPRDGQQGQAQTRRRGGEETQQLFSWSEWPCVGRGGSSDGRGLWKLGQRAGESEVQGSSLISLFRAPVSKPSSRSTPKNAAGPIGRRCKIIEKNFVDPDVPDSVDMERRAMKIFASAPMAKVAHSIVRMGGGGQRLRG